MKMLMQYLQKPKDLTMPERVEMGRDIVKGLQEKGMSFKSAYMLIEDMQDVFKRAEWRLKDDAFHSVEDKPVVHMLHDDEKTY